MLTSNPSMTTVSTHPRLPPATTGARSHRGKTTGKSLATAAAAITMAVTVCWLLESTIGTSDMVMIFLLAVIVVAFTSSLATALIAVALAVATFDFLFVLPKYTFSVTDGRYLITFAVMTLVGVAVATLSTRVRMQAKQLAELEVERETERLRAALLSSVSHDLRTPLSTILGAATALLDEQTKLPQGRRMELLRSIETHADHLSRLLRNLLEMTRLDRDPRARSLEPYAVEESVETAIRGLAVETQHRINVSVADAPAFAFMDPVAVEIVLSNLLENAAKYSPAQSPIEVRIAAEHHSVLVEVRDHGIGVSPNDRERIFEKFARGVHPSIPGVGLGLAIARVIVEAHGGHLDYVEADNGSGSVFAFTLPGANTSTAEEMMRDD